MKLKTQFILLAVLPLLVVATSITFISVNQARFLGEQEIQTFERNLLSSKRSALRHYVSLALTAIDHVYRSDVLPESIAKAQVKSILHGLTYGDDGYFFAYDDMGVNLVHPIQSELVGRNLIDLQDNKGDYVIRNLLDRAREGGGFHRYVWNKPSRGEAVDKLSYVVQLPGWNWMLGTGLYIDDIAAEIENIQTQVNDNIQRTFVTMVAIISVTVILVIAFGVAFNVHEHKSADNKLRALAHKSVQFQVSERRRFSRELHDGINQLMVSVKFRVELVLNRLQGHADEDRRDLDKARQLLDQAIQEVRRISHDLRPTVLDDLGLQQALDSLMDEFSQRTDIQVVQETPLESQRLPEEIEITVYRIIQEALSNIERHADASHVVLKTIWQNDSFRLEVQDNGLGFDREQVQPSAGIGLLNMQERVELLGGTFSLHAEPGNGTRLRADFPMGLYS